MFDGHTGKEALILCHMGVESVLVRHPEKRDRGQVPAVHTFEPNRTINAWGDQKRTQKSIQEFDLEGSGEDLGRGQAEQNRKVDNPLLAGLQNKICRGEKGLAPIIENRDAKLRILRLVAVDEVEFCLKPASETDVGDSIRMFPQRSRLPPRGD